jgi:hypothetical protein
MPGQKREDALALLAGHDDSKQNAPIGFKPEGALFR